MPGLCDTLVLSQVRPGAPAVVDDASILANPPTLVQVWACSSVLVQLCVLVCLAIAVIAISIMMIMNDLN